MLVLTTFVAVSAVGLKGANRTFLAWWLWC